ncbi:vWA domain-containing protein [Rhodothermus profundi]|uniref:Ca-activated chloride channel family protein n=1 Tax=Rhodothermus profundi TaxID=633813 RepID=A0A1M6RTQ1_9BACT|nr:VWA domain-containing protein [Rhodothermus profundi]SHK35891.1 Ca-activated chloride channel family protein [Rhodothermus profundi]
MTFAQPQWLWLLVLVPFLAFVRWWHTRRQSGDLLFSSTALVDQVPATFWSRLRGLPFALRLATLTLGILALARPQQPHVFEKRTVEGRDLMLVLDLSSSMLAQDFTPSRFEVARRTAIQFVQGRPVDRIGLVVFAGQAFTQVPPTLDHRFLLTMLRRLQVGRLEDGTAIGTAIATAVNRLKNTEARSKVIILLTDGQNNRGEIDPPTAAELARQAGIRIYTIGLSGRGEAPYPRQTPSGTRPQPVPVEIDEAMMRDVAEKTGGRYFRATDARTLEAIYAEIDRLEKSPVAVTRYETVRERYAVFLGPALLLLLLEVVLRTTRLRRLVVT